MKSVFKYYKRYWYFILVALSFLTIEAICELELPGYMSSMISEGVALSDIAAIKSYGLKMLLITLAAVVSAIVVGFMASKTAGLVSRDIRHDVYRKVMSFASEEYNKFNVSSLITRSTNDISQIQMVTVMFIRMVMFTPVMGIGGIIKAMKYSSGISGLAYLIIGAIVLIVILIVLLLVFVQPKFLKMQKQIDNVNQISNEELSGMLVIRAFNNETHEEERFDNANKDLTKTSLFVNRVIALLMPVMNLVMYGVSLGVVTIAAFSAEDITQVANMMAFIQYGTMIIMSFMLISMVFVLIPRAMVSVRRIGEIFDTEVSIVNSQGNETPKNEKVNGIVEFKNVAYSYGGNNAIEDISFVARPGEVTAIIGSTGSGKSTIVNMIPRLTDVTNGNITIDGKDIKDYNLHDLRENIGFVPQKNTLFSGSIRSNIKYGANDIDDAAMEQAANIAQATEFIDSKENRYDSEIAQGGSNVSGGQKQRLAIARAIAKKAPIMVFDDSFSALDFKTDLNLRKAIKKELSNSTIIIVAQRVGTIMNADQIIVLDDGHIVGIGTHQELLKNCKVYLDIAESQLSKEELK